MFSLLTRFLLFLLRAPKTIIAFAIIASILSIKPILDLRWELSLSALLPQEHPAVALQDSVYKKFGSSEKLIVVAKCQDSVQNAKFVKKFAENLQNNPLVNLVEFETEADFYSDHRFLYIRMHDLEVLYGRIKKMVIKQKEKLNPFIVDLIGDSAEINNEEPDLFLDDVEQKYTQKLKGFMGSADGKIRVVEIYPSKDNTNLQDMREFFRSVDKAASRALSAEAASRAPNDIEILYGGTVYDFVSDSRTLLSEIRYIAWISAGILLLVFIGACFKIPAISIITAICLSMAALWTFAAAGILYGRINLFSLLLGLIIPAIGGRNATHFLSRYTEEMQKGLSVKLAIESALLGICPPFAVSAFLSASMLFCLMAMPLQGVREIGFVGGLGILFEWLAVSTILPALLKVMQKKRKFKLYAKINYRRLDFAPRPLKFSKAYICIVIAATAALSVGGFFLSGGILPKMEYRFSKVDLPKPSAPVTKILRSIDEYSENPVIVMFPSVEYARDAVDKYPNINWVTLESLLPSQQDKKLRIIAEIKELLSPETLSNLRGDDSLSVQKIIENLDVSPLKTDDLPESYQLKFQGKDGSLGEFGFVFPSWDINDGLQNRRFAHSVSEVKFLDGSPLIATGVPIMRAAFLDLTLPELHKSILLGGLSILLWLLIFQNRRNRIFLLLISPAFGFLWMCGMLNLLDIPLTVYSVFAFPFLIGIAIDGSLFLWQRYWEEGTGSLRFVCLQSGRSVAISYLIPLVAFSSLCFASHPGLRSLGVVSVLGLICILLAHAIIFPVVASFVDLRRYRNRKNRRMSAAY